MGLIEIGPQPGQNAEEVSEVAAPESNEDPNVAYVRRAKQALTDLENHPMSTHETRLLKTALLVIFGPAIAEAEKGLTKDEA